MSFQFFSEFTEEEYKKCFMISVQLIINPVISSFSFCILLFLSSEFKDKQKSKKMYGYGSNVKTK